MTLKSIFFQTETEKGTDGETTNRSEDEAGEDQQIGEEEHQGEMTEVQVGEENDEGTTNDAGTVTQEEPKAAKSKKFHDLILRNTIKSFKSILVTQVIKRGDKSSTVSVNHDIIESLLSFSTKHEKLIGSC